MKSTIGAALITVLIAVNAPAAQGDYRYAGEYVGYANYYLAEAWYDGARALYYDSLGYYSYASSSVLSAYYDMSDAAYYIDAAWYQTPVNSNAEYWIEVAQDDAYSALLSLAYAYYGYSEYVPYAIYYAYATDYDLSFAGIASVWGY